MMKEWYEGTELEKKISNLKSTNVKYITDFHYYIGYNSYYDQVSFLEIDSLLEVDNRKFTLRMKFNDVSSLDLLGFRNNYNLLMGFKINNLSASGFEQNNHNLLLDLHLHMIMIKFVV